MRLVQVALALALATSHVVSFGWAPLNTPRDVRRRRPLGKWPQRVSARSMARRAASAGSSPDDDAAAAATTVVEEAAAKTGVARIIIAGAPASGKGTQCEMISETYGVVHLSTGDMLRAAVQDGTPLGVTAKEFMDAGKLVPDELIIGIVTDRIAQDDCKCRGWLLDGFPRTKAQADALAAEGVSADAFLLLDVPDDILVERVTGRRTDPETGRIYHTTFNPPPEEIKDRLTQRSDDTAEKIVVRVDAFNDNLASIVDSYKDVMVKVDGVRAPADVFGSIKAALDDQLLALPGTTGA